MLAGRVKPEPAFSKNGEVELEKLLESIVRKRENRRTTGSGSSPKPGVNNRNEFTDAGCEKKIKYAKHQATGSG
jgi:hypothetical protein